MIPSEVEEIIKSACIKIKRPCEVTRMDPGEFYDIKSVADENVTSKLEIKKVSWIKVLSSDPSKVCTRFMFNDIELWRITAVLRKKKICGICIYL